MNKLQILMELRNSLLNEIVVSPLGNTSELWFSIKDISENFYMLGSMGLTIPFAMGIALSVKENVYVIDGDGSVLMNLGTLTTVGSQNIDNLKIVILDNESYNTTGGQPSATSHKTKLNEISRGTGIPSIVVRDLSEIGNSISWLKEKGTRLLVVKITKEEFKMPSIKLSPYFISKRIKSVILNKNTSTLQ